MENEEPDKNWLEQYEGIKLLCCKINNFECVLTNGHQIISGKLEYHKGMFHNYSVLHHQSFYNVRNALCISLYILGLRET